jgi:hypothetical protein
MFLKAKNCQGKRMKLAFTVFLHQLTQPPVRKYLFFY